MSAQCVLGSCGDVAARAVVLCVSWAGGTRCPAQSCERCIASYVAVLAQGKTIANHKTKCVIHPKQSTERKREDSVGCRR